MLGLSRQIYAKLQKVDVRLNRRSTEIHPFSTEMSQDHNGVDDVQPEKFGVYERNDSRSIETALRETQCTVIGCAEIFSWADDLQNLQEYR
jgi:hypothetical protein